MRNIMQNLVRLTLYFLIFFLLLSMKAYGQADSIIGIWLTEVKSHIKIIPCSEGYCGYINKVAIRDEIYIKYKKEIDEMGVQNIIDFFNEEPALRTRPLLGLKIMTLKYDAKKKIFNGEVYNPEDGKTYLGKIEIINKDQLRLTGCTFFNLLCKSENWFRIGNID